MNTKQPEALRREYRAAMPPPALLMERAMSDMQCPYCAQREVSQ